MIPLVHSESQTMICFRGRIAGSESRRLADVTLLAFWISCGCLHRTPVCRLKYSGPALGIFCGCCCTLVMSLFQLAEQYDAATNPQTPFPIANRNTTVLCRAPGWASKAPLQGTDSSRRGGGGRITCASTTRTGAHGNSGRYALPRFMLRT
jgi:hypothetical protein